MNGIELIKNIHNVTFTWNNFLMVYIVLLLLDTILLLVIKKYRPSTESKYFKWHYKHGIMKITLLKILFISGDMYLLSSFPIGGGFTASYQIGYAILIILVFRDFLRKDNKKIITLI